MSDEELKPCPFCGDEAHVWYFRDRGFNRVRIVCDTCCVQGPSTHYNDVKDVIAAWNRRAARTLQAFRP